VSRDGSLFDKRPRTIEIRHVNRDALVSAATSLCRRLSIPCLVFRDLSPKTLEFYLFRLVER